MDTPIDIERDRYNEWKDTQRMAMQDECENCTEHNAGCPFYDAEQESWDYMDCSEVRG